MSDSARIDELLVQETVDGLTDRERAELEALLSAHPQWDRTVVERAAAAITLAVVGAAHEPLPSHLRDRIEAACEWKQD